MLFYTESKRIGVSLIRLLGNCILQFFTLQICEVENKVFHLSNETFKFTNWKRYLLCISFATNCKLVFPLILLFPDMKSLLIRWILMNSLVVTWKNIRVPISNPRVIRLSFIYNHNKTDVSSSFCIRLMEIRTVSFDWIV